MRIFLQIGLFFFAVFFSGGAVPASAETRVLPPLVLVSIPPQAELVTRLAGTLVRVQVMLPSGANHEAFDATMGQLSALSQASLYIKLGHPKFLFETKLIDEMLRSQKNLRVVNSATGVALDKNDIHYWTSPKLLRESAVTIGAALAELVPEHKAEIESARAALDSELAKLDSDLRQMFAPWKGSSFLVFHPAWGYFAREYGLNQLAIEQEGKEPGIAQLQRVVEKARGLGVRTVFIEPGSPRESVKYLVESLGGKSVVLDPVDQHWIANLRTAAAAFTESFKEAATK